MSPIMTKDKSSKTQIGESIVKSACCGKELDIKIDSKLHF